MSRISKDEYYLNIAEAVLDRSTCLRRKYGAVLVKDDQIIGTGYNGSPRGELNCCDIGHCKREEQGVAKGERYELCVAIHAEDNCIMNAGRRKSLGATLYIVGKEVANFSDRNEVAKYANPNPCMMCRRKIVNAGIVRVVGRSHETGKPIEINMEDLKNLYSGDNKHITP